MSRDVIDLMVMEHHWGEIPRPAWEKASGAYGDYVHVALRKAKELLQSDPKYLSNCLEKMGIGEDIGSELRKSLGLEHDRALGVTRPLGLK